MTEYIYVYFQSGLKNLREHTLMELLVVGTFLPVLDMECDLLNKL